MLTRDSRLALIARSNAIYRTVSLLNPRPQPAHVYRRWSTGSLQLGLAAQRLMPIGVLVTLAIGVLVTLAVGDLLSRAAPPRLTYRAGSRYA